MDGVPHSRRNPVLERTRPWFVADDGKNVYGFLFLYFSCYSFLIVLSILCFFKSASINTKQIPTVSPKKRAIIFDSTIYAQLDHQSYFGCLQADPAGFGYPKILLNYA